VSRVHFGCRVNSNKRWRRTIRAKGNGQWGPAYYQSKATYVRKFSLI
jgi:hypothetical protein